MQFARPLLIAVASLVLLGSGCIAPKEKISTPKLFKTENASQSQLLSEVNRFALVGSMRAKMNLKFEDNSFAESGIAEKYKAADGEVVVQRPANILLKVQVPFIKTDIAHMASDGRKFCIAILQTGGDDRFKKFVCGTNSADYSALQDKVKETEVNNGAAIKQNVNAFSNLRPQHFTDALLVRPTDEATYSYLVSTILQEETDFELLKKKSPLARVLRGYYLLEEFKKGEDGMLKIVRRFWFDRVGGIRLARQQIFDDRGEIDSDIVYGQQGDLGTDADYKNLPLRITVTRPKDKYSMTLTYQSPEAVMLGRKFPEDAFRLKNQWGLEELDLDQKLRDAREKATQNSQPSTSAPNQ